MFESCSRLTEIRYFECETHSTEEMAQSLFLTRSVPFQFRPVELVMCGMRYSDKMACGVPVNPSMGANSQ